MCAVPNPVCAKRTENSRIRNSWFQHEAVKGKSLITQYDYTAFYISHPHSSATGCVEQVTEISVFESAYSIIETDGVYDILSEERSARMVELSPVNCAPLTRTVA